MTDKQVVILVWFKEGTTGITNSIYLSSGLQIEGGRVGEWADSLGSF